MHLSNWKGSPLYRRVLEGYPTISITSKGVGWVYYKLMGSTKQWSIMSIHVVNPDIGLDGRWGGKDNLIINELFKGQLTRSHHETHDAVDSDGNYYEIKKQQNLQWFDPRKYTSMDTTLSTTQIIFIVWEKDVGVVTVALCSTINFIREIFNDDLLDLASKVAIASPRTQLKHPVYIKSMISKNPKLFDIIYQRSN